VNFDIAELDDGKHTPYIVQLAEGIEKYYVVARVKMIFQPLINNCIASGTIYICTCTI